MVVTHKSCLEKLEKKLLLQRHIHIEKYIFIFRNFETRRSRKADHLECKNLVNYTIRQIFCPTIENNFLC